MPEYKFRNRSLTLRERIRNLLSELTTEEKIYMLSSNQHAVERLGIGEWHIGCEAARGYISRGENGEKPEISTVFPQPIGMAATFDKELMRSIGETAGKDARYYYSNDPHGRLMLWGPTVDMERHPLWGRTEEAYGEDTCLAGEMSREYTIGLAGASRADEPTDKSIMSCTTADPGVLLRTLPALKHFCANNNEENRGSGNSNVTNRLLAEYYYRAFKPALTEGGAHSAMAAYNKIGGVPGDLNPDIKRVLKDKWGMDFAVTDGGAFSQNLLAHRFTSCHGESLAMAIKNGVDVMTDDAEAVAAAAHDALKKGYLTEEDIDKAVGASLLGRFRLGEFDGEHKYSHESHTPDNTEDRALNLRAAREQVCLLKNDNALPLNKNTAQKLLIAGPIADENYRDWYTGTASYAVSVRKAFEEQGDILFDNGWDIVAVKSLKNGKFLSVSEDGKAAFTADNIGDSEKFELHCWDDDTYNFKSLSNGKFLQENGEYKALSDTPYDWFIREWFKVRHTDGYVYFDSWHDDAVYVNDSLALSTKPPCRPDEGRLFEIVTVSPGSERLKELAAQADTVILCCGNHPMQIARECYDRKTLALPPHQHKLAMAVPSEKLILTVISSYPYAIPEETAHASAVLWSSHCGAPLGNAVCDTVFGDNNPAARCPMTWYKRDSDLPPITQYDIIASESTYMYFKGEPLFPFGHGLSYSSFAYSSFALSMSGEFVNISLDISNTSETDGDEAVQIYYKETANRPYKPEIRLCGFERVFVKAGETVNVRLSISAERLTRYDSVTGEMLLFEGEYEFFAASSCKDLRLSRKLHIAGCKQSARPTGEFIPAVRCDHCRGGQEDFSVSENGRYLLFGDWGGAASFEMCPMQNCKNILLKVSAPIGTAHIEIIAEGDVIGKCAVPPSPRADEFREITVPVNCGSDMAKLTFSIRGQAGIYGFTLMN